MRVGLASGGIAPPVWLRPAERASGEEKLAQALVQRVAPAPDAGRDSLVRQANDIQALSRSGSRAQSIRESLQDVRSRLSNLRDRLAAAPNNVRTASGDEAPAADGAVRSSRFRDVVETRAIYEIEQTFEEQAVYEERDIRRTVVTGTRNIAQQAYQGWDDAGINEGDTFTVRVGNGPESTVKFEKNERISVTTNGVKQKFEFYDGNGEWRGGLTAALNSIEGLEASINAQGRLQLQTEGDDSLTLGQFLFGPLSELGLSAGTTSSTVVGTEQVQTGTEQVLVSEEQVLAGYEDVVVGQEVERDDVAAGAAQSSVARAWGGTFASAGNAGAQDFAVSMQLAFVDRTARAGGANDLLAGGAFASGEGRNRISLKGEDLSLRGLGLDRMGFGMTNDLDAAIAAIDGALGKAGGLAASIAAQVDRGLQGAAAAALGTGAAASYGGFAPVTAGRAAGRLIVRSV